MSITVVPIEATVEEDVTEFMSKDEGIPKLVVGRIVLANAVESGLRDEERVLRTGYEGAVSIR